MRGVANNEKKAFINSFGYIVYGVFLAKRV